MVAAVLEADDIGIALLGHVWRALPDDVEESWPRRLYECAAPLAVQRPSSRELAGALRAGAEVLRHRGWLRPAAGLGIHELAIRRLLDDPQPHTDALHSLAATYRAQHRMHRVIECADEVLELNVRHARPDGIARALARLGTLMTEVGRLDSAVNYLTRADKALGTLDAEEERARVQVDLGRALWLGGDEAAGRRRLRRTLPYLPDPDVQRVRQLLDLPNGSTLNRPELGGG
ncbi:tetratricopeptide repeat protein [Saccharothrix obliqua]|uniref:tetratricopeptide repeat protein n=1 Tax=Saccharothrix obliqua TaxID=2861747 RepID=UPI001C5E7974|nr:tetratricopeptide repeat protein [Saccharothrix obliqua]MBW4717400.1 tetratricopeptide repeat protein [Saccharothrix obliqua]